MSFLSALTPIFNVTASSDSTQKIAQPMVSSISTRTQTSTFTQAPSQVPSDYSTYNSPEPNCQFSSPSNITASHNFLPNGTVSWSNSAGGNVGMTIVPVNSPLTLWSNGSEYQYMSPGENVTFYRQPSGCSGVSSTSYDKIITTGFGTNETLEFVFASSCTPIFNETSGNSQSVIYWGGVSFNSGQMTSYDPDFSPTTDTLTIQVSTAIIDPVVNFFIPFNEHLALARDTTGAKREIYLMTP